METVCCYEMKKSLIITQGETQGETVAHCKTVRPVRTSTKGKEISLLQSSAHAHLLVCYRVSKE